MAKKQIALVLSGGWKIEANFPNETKYVLIFAHRTSNWDFVLGLLAALSIGFWPQWIGKNSLFRWPLGGLMRWWGGVPVDRSKSHNPFLPCQQCVIQRFPPIKSSHSMEGSIA